MPHHGSVTSLQCCVCLLLQVKRAVTESGGELIAGPLGSPWDVRLGRVDNATAAPEGRIPTAESSIPEIKVRCRA